MQMTLLVKAVGRNAALVNRPVNLELPEHPTARDVLTQIVRGEVVAFKQRQVESQTLRALTERMLKEGVERGKIESFPERVPQPISTSKATRIASEAFGDGLFHMFVDDAQITALDAPLNLHAESRVMFLRLVALAGG